MTGMLAMFKSALTVFNVVFCVAFLAVVNAVNEEEVRPSDEPSECKCKFPKHNTPDSKMLEEIRPLCGKR